MPYFKPQQRAHSPQLAVGLASESKIDKKSLRGLRSTAGRQNFPAAFRRVFKNRSTGSAGLEEQTNLDLLDTDSSKPRAWVLLILVSGFSLFSAKPIIAGGLKDLAHLIGSQDAISVVDSDGGVVLSKNAEKKRVPASILKIFTALTAFYYLGETHRFQTEFYMDQDSNLKIKGFGDPLLISEVLIEISDILKTKFSRIRDIVLDDTYFQAPLTIPGTTSSFEPYDAPNGALCVNFNTVFFKRQQDAYVSAEPQTPLLPFVLPRIRKSNLARGRIVLSAANRETTRYTGYLIRYFLRKKKIKLSGKVRLGRVEKEKDHLIFRYVSRYTLKQIIAKLLRYSNNFIANQILIASGAKAYSPPGSLDNGVRAGRDFAAQVLKIDSFSYVEGSGISKKNRISADSMQKVLERFKPYRYLLRRSGSELYKTGSLKGVQTRAGYIESSSRGLYTFVVMLNTPGHTTGDIMARLSAAFN